MFLSTGHIMLLARIPACRPETHALAVWPHPPSPQMDIELSYYNLNLKELNAAGVSIEFIEFGIGGGTSQDGDQKATTALEAAYWPFWVGRWSTGVPSIHAGWWCCEGMPAGNELPSSYCGPLTCCAGNPWRLHA